MTNNLLQILILGTIVTILTGIPVLVLFALKRIKFLEQKNDAYECGFQRLTKIVDLEVQFFKVVFLFLFFDIEFILLMPWALHFHSNSMSANWIVYIFLYMLLFSLYVDKELGILIYV